MRPRLVLVTLTFVSCHLADDPEPPRCPEGTHPELGQCVADANAKVRIALAPAPSCPTVTPDSVRVKAGQDFQFDNDDVVAHVVRGTSDGQVWVEVPARSSSPFTSIVKPGAWGFEVSACGSRGTVVVE